MAMFCTQEEVEEMTGYEVSGLEVIRAQTIIESFMGKTEGDVSNPHDRVILARATAYQAAYMQENYDAVFKQVPLSQLTSNGSVMTFKAGDNTSPFIAPLAVIAMTNLSWRKSRTVKTGRIIPRRQIRDWRER